MSDYGARNAADQRPSYGTVGARADEQQIDVRASELEDRARWVGPKQNPALYLSATHFRQGGVERVLRGLLLALEGLAALDRDQRLQPREGYVLSGDRRWRLDHHQHTQRGLGPYCEVVRGAKRKLSLLGAVERDRDLADTA